jgi:hypothetical protein
MSDEYWRRPTEDTPSLTPPPAPAPAVGPATASYTGAPRNVPPPHGWRPPMVIQPAPPRVLPKQDLERLDREEQAATILTKGIGIFVGAVLIALLLIFCGGLIF